MPGEVSPVVRRTAPPLVPRTAWRPVRRAALPLLAAALLLAGCGAEPAVVDAQAAEPAHASPSTSPTPDTAVPSERLRQIDAHRSATAPRQVAPPERIRVPAIGIDSRLQRLGREQDGSIEVPSDWDTAGWYTRGARPGQAGPAVILGHVDSKAGPAVFFRLRELRHGDRIVITRTDGSEVTFTVDRVERHRKTRFPTDDVYLPTLRPTLRLVTCDGVFDAATGHYRDNLVVFADLAT